MSQSLPFFFVLLWVMGILEFVLCKLANFIFFFFCYKWYYHILSSFISTIYGIIYLRSKQGISASLLWTLNDLLITACSWNYFIQTCGTKRPCKMALTISERWVRWKAYLWCDWEDRNASCSSWAFFKGCGYCSLSGTILLCLFSCHVLNSQPLF